MARTLSVQKNVRQNEKRRKRNLKVKSNCRTLFKNALEAIKKQEENAEEIMREAISAYDRAARKGIFHKNLSSRKKGRLMSLYEEKIKSSSQK